MGFYLVVVFISMMCIETGSFHVSSIAPNVTVVVYGILFSGVLPLRQTRASHLESHAVFP